MSIVLFWIVSCLVGFNCLVNFVAMFGLEKGKDRATQAASFLINSTFLIYVLFFSSPK